MRDPVVYETTIPLVIQSAANLRVNWRSRASTAKKHRYTAAIAMTGLFGRFDWPGRVVITLTRLGGRGLDDDNLAYAFKAVRDGVADWLGIDDGSPRLTWRYAQEPGGTKGIRVHVEEVP